MSDRLSLAIPIDTARLFDSTTTQPQIDSDIFQGSSDDDDLLASYLEDAADEFRALTDDAMRVSRVGVADKRETFENATYKVSGHKLTKGTFTGTWTDFLPEQQSIMLDNQRVLPFDSAAGDAVYLYQGLAESGDSWEDVTDHEGEMWEIVDHTAGRFAFSPIDIAETVMTGRPTAFGRVPEFLKRMRFAISYRYGGLGGSRGRASETTLDASLTDTQTGTVAVADGTAFPTGNAGGSIIVLIGTEYLEVLPDPANDQMDVLTRGVRGTVGQSHSSGDRLTYTPPSVRKAVASRAAMTLIDSGRHAAWLPSEDDSISKDMMVGDFKETWNRTVEALS